VRDRGDLSRASVFEMALKNRMPGWTGHPTPIQGEEERRVLDELDFFGASLLRKLNN
jgi:hypothetical protein